MILEFAPTWPAVVVYVFALIAGAACICMFLIAVGKED